jgi:hypothetical protein
MPDGLVGRVAPQNRRALYGIAAKAYFYQARAYELAGRFDQLRKCVAALLPR